MNIALLLGALLGFSYVAMGAYAAHVLQAKLSAASFSHVMIALHYQGLHALLVTALGLLTWLLPDGVRRRQLTALAWLFFAAVLLFSGSIYLAALTPWLFLRWLAPSGGVLLMLAWLRLAYLALKYPRLVSF